MRKAPHFTLPSKVANVLKMILCFWSIPFANSKIPSSSNPVAHCQLFFASTNNTNIFSEFVADKVRKIMLSIAISRLMDWFVLSKTK